MLGIGRRTDSGADVARAEGLDGEVWVDLADDLGGIAIGEVRVLQRMLVMTIVALYRELTRLRRMVTTPSASMVAWSPRSCVTLPTMVTVRPTKLSR